jgi:PAS domain S-box-containing protein
MAGSELSRRDPHTAGSTPSGPGGLLDALGVAAVLLDAEGRIDLWSPQAEDLFGYSAEEALGEFAGRLLVHEEDRELVLNMFAEVMEGGGSWAGVFPVRHKDGRTRLVEFRNMRLQDDQREYWAWPPTRRRYERSNGTWHCPPGWCPSRRSGWGCWTPIFGTFRSTRRRSG